MRGSPGVVRVEVLAVSAVRVIDAAVEDMLFCPAFQRCERDFTKQGNGIMVQLTPPSRIKVAEEARGFRIPTPPKIARKRPEAFLDGCDEPVSMRAS
jgi:hypothetical protein